MKKALFVILLVAALSAFAVVPALADSMCTEVMAPTVASLYDCVQHAYAQGHINDAGVAQSLLAKLSAAQAAVNQGQPAVAVNILQAFIYEVQAQAGVHILADHAQHLVDHAQMVIQALSAQP